MFATADVQDALTGLLGALGAESDTPNSSTAVYSAVEAEQIRAD